MLAGNVLANDTDPEGNTLTAVLVSGPAHGTLTLNADGSFTYTPNANFHGGDSFTYRANDGTLNSGLATVTLTVTSVNDAPLATDDLLVTDEDAAHTLNVVANDSDPDGDALAVSSVTQGTNGSVSFSGGSVTYTPHANFNGSDSFSYTVSDGNGGSATATVNVTVNPVNDAPAFSSSPVASATEGTAYSYGIVAGDVEDDPLAIPAAALPAWLTLTDHGDGTATLSGTPAHADVGSAIAQRAKPLGLFRAWSYVEPDAQGLVYPKPERSPLPAPQAEVEGGATQLLARGNDDFAGLRSYQRSDSPRHVAWKAAARTGELLTKQFSGEAALQLWLDWQALPRDLHTEARLSRLAGWVLAAERGGARYGLRLPGVSFGCHGRAGAGK